MLQVLFLLLEDRAEFGGIEYFSSALDLSLDHCGLFGRRRVLMRVVMVVVALLFQGIMDLG